MKLPFDRERMRERNLLDDIDEIAQAARQTPSDRFAAGPALSDLAIAMLRGNPDRRARRSRPSLGGGRRTGGERRSLAVERG